jgi:hypothetical protein
MDNSDLYLARRFVRKWKVCTQMEPLRAASRRHLKGSRVGPNPRRPLRQVFLVLSVFLGSILGYGPPPSVAGAAEPSRQAAADDDELFVMVGRRVPSFGGAYVDQGGTLRVWLTEPRAEAARQRDALVEIVGEDFAVERLAVLEAKYSWLELRRWYVAMQGIHQVAPDLVFTDMDEARNRITIALEDPDRHRAAVEAELDRLGIPGEAVNIEQSAPIQEIPTSGRGSAPFLSGLLALVVLAAAALLVRKRRAASAATP